MSGRQVRDAVLSQAIHKTRYDDSDSVGGLGTVLQMRNCVVTPEVYAHLEETFASAFMFLDPNNRANIAEMHDDINPSTNNELSMQYLTR